MKTKLLLCLLLLFALGSGVRSNAIAQVESENFIPGELIVRLQSVEAERLDAKQLEIGDLGTASLNELGRRFQVRHIRRVFANTSNGLARKYGLPATFVLTVPANTNLWAMREAYRANPLIAYAEFNWRLRATDLPNDTLFGQQWNLHNQNDHDIDAPEAWDKEQGKSEILVAVIDTGVLYTHPDLDGGRVRTDIDKDFVSDDDDALDDHGHGTHVAGIIAADTNNAEGIAGICRGCTILPVKVLDQDGSGTAENVAAGIQYAADQGAQILNMSLGMSPSCGCSKTIAQAINYAFDKGALIISAAGNDGKRKLSYPSASPRSMAIGATDSNDKKTDFSNFGKGLDLVAPGAEIWSTILDDEYEAWSGTSMAAPHAAGVAGLILSKNSNLTNVQVWWILRKTTDDLKVEGWDKWTGFGRLNAHKAVRFKRTGQVQAAIDDCNKEPEPGCGDCSTSVALDTIQTRAQDLQTLYAFRDQVLAKTARGQQLTRFFYRHNLELAWLLATDPALREQAAGTLQEVLPGFRALTANDPETPFVLTSSYLHRVFQLKENIRQRASATFAADLENEWQRIAPEQFAGLEIHQVWNRINSQP